MLTETAAPAIGQPVIDELATHLKLASGFGSEAEAELEGSLRAAIAHLEARLGLALVQRDFIWRGGLGADATVTAPIAPVSVISNVQRVLADGTTEALDFSGWTLNQGPLRTRFCADVYLRDQIDITFTAGFGANWTDTPADLRQAVLLMAAHFYENRYATAIDADIMPLGVKALISPWRPVRIGLGRTA
ncbi:MAG: head-tail connector protein [Pseudomonadota bacterium]